MIYEHTMMIDINLRGTPFYGVSLLLANSIFQGQRQRVYGSTRSGFSGEIAPRTVLSCHWQVCARGAPSRAGAADDRLRETRSVYPEKRTVRSLPTKKSLGASVVRSDRTVSRHAVSPVRFFLATSLPSRTHMTYMIFIH